MQALWFGNKNLYSKKREIPWNISGIYGKGNKKHDIRFIFILSWVYAIGIHLMTYCDLCQYVLTFDSSSAEELQKKCNCIQKPESFIKAKKKTKKKQGNTKK